MLLRFLSPLDWALRSYRWYRRLVGGEWVEGFYLNEFTSWCRVADWDSCPIRQRREFRREPWPPNPSSPPVYERLCVDVETGERMIDFDGWEFEGHTCLGFAMWVRRRVA